MRQGFHLITNLLVQDMPPIADIAAGTVHFFIRHTSASLTLNENADPDVRGDLERWCAHHIREREPFYRHTLEGDDDMPAHVAAVMVGPDLTIPISDGRLALGTWQGIYLGEHRRHGGPRQVVITVCGGPRQS